jgi:hypothetical protein
LENQTKINETRRIESVSVSFDLMPKIAFKKFKELVNFDNLLKMKEFFFPTSWPESVLGLEGKIITKSLALSS